MRRPPRAAGLGVTVLLALLLGLARLAPAIDVSPAPPALPVGQFFNVKQFGAKGDGVTDDRLAIAAAVTAVSAAGGGILYFPAGTYVGNSSSPVLAITDNAHNIIVMGAGISATTLKQLGSGHVISVDGTATTELYGVVLREFTIDGNGTANDGIYTAHAKDMLIERLSITACTGHGIEVTGFANLNGIIRQVRIGTNTNPAATKAAITITTGNQWRVEHSYINGGGNPDNGGNGYTTGIDARGVAGMLLLGNIYDGLKYGVQSNGQLTAIQEYVDLTSGDPTRLTNGYYPQANNQFVLIGALNSTVFGNVAQKLVKLDGNIARKYITVIGANDGAHSGVVAGMPRWSVLTPAAITASQNDYEPLDAAVSDGRYHGVWNISANAATYFITGIAGGEDGDVRVIHNVGSNAITFRYESSSSAAANRIRSTDVADWPLRAGESMVLVYDGSVSRWRVASLYSASPQPDSRDVLTPAQITGNQNDYAPTGMAGTHHWRLSTDASRNITGISAGGVSFSVTYVVDGYRITIVNVGGFNVVLQNENVGSVAGNRIITGIGADLTLTPNQVATLIYDATTARWRVISRNF